MKHEVIYRGGADRLLLLFAGWGMDPHPFRGIDGHGYDVMLLYDYTDGTAIDERLLDGYSEVCVLAWSYGVAVASRFIAAHASDKRLTHTVAVNGTPWPVDNRRGINRRVFSATLDAMSEPTVEAFFANMCGSPQELEQFQKVRPQRDVESLRCELEIFAAWEPAEDARWDTAYIADADRIVPAANQMRGWAACADVRPVEGGHLPDFQSIICNSFVDKGLVSKRFKQAATSYESAAELQRTVAAELFEMWRKHTATTPKVMVEIGCGTGMLTRQLVEEAMPEKLILWDISTLPDDIEGDNIEKKITDAEIEIGALAPESVDCIISASTIQWFNSVRGFMEHACEALRPGGMLAFSTFGEDTFAEIRELTGASVTHYSVDSLKAMVPEGMEIVEVAERRAKSVFESPAKMLHHLKESGVNGVATATPIAATRRLLREYPTGSEGTELIYHPIFMILQKKEPTK